MKKIRAGLKNKHFLSLAGNGIMSVLGMATIALLYRALSAEDTGKWVFFLSMLLLVDTFRSGFITTAFIKFYAGADEKRTAEIAGATWYVAGAITAVLLLLNLIALLFADRIANESVMLFLKWFGITYTVTLPFYIATCVVQAEQRFDRLLYIRFINQGLFILLVILLIVMDAATLQHIIYANLATGIVTSLFTVLAGWSRISTFRSRTASAIREMFHFGKYSVGTTLSANLFRTSDTFLITFLLGPAALAIYNLGQRLMEVVEIPLRSFAATGMPELSAAYNQGNRELVIFTMKKYAGMLTVALVPACFAAVLLADVAIGIIGGSQYADSEAANVLRIFMLFALLYPLDRFLALTLDVIHKPKINFIKVLIMLVANVVAGYTGIKLLGNVYGVALGNFVPIVIAIIIGYKALCRFQPFTLRSVFTVGYAEARHVLRKLLLKARRGEKKTPDFETGYASGAKRDHQEE